MICNSKNNFLKIAKNKYQDFFCYSLLDYRSVKEKIKIICPIHGVIITTPQEHLRSKKGCYQCNQKHKSKISKKINEINKKKLYKKHIQNAQNKFGNVFDYSKIDTKTKLKDKVEIICTKHGSFNIEIIQHIKNKYGGCIKCYEELKEKKYKYSLKEFIELSNKKYNKKFNYSLIKKISKVTDKVKIICPNPNHGIFEQQVDLHLKQRTKYGCPKCMQEYIHKQQSLSQKDFIKKCFKFFGNKLDFSSAKYVNHNTPVKITCKEHSYTYEQHPSNLFRKATGCKFCHKKNKTFSGSFFKKNKKAYIYLFKIDLCLIKTITGQK